MRGRVEGRGGMHLLRLHLLHLEDAKGQLQMAMTAQKPLVEVQDQLLWSTVGQAHTLPLVTPPPPVTHHRSLSLHEEAAEDQ